MKPMKLVKAISVSTLSLFLGASALMYAQEQHEDAKPNDESRPAASKPAQDEKAKPAHDDKRGDMAKPQEPNRDQTTKSPEQNEDKATRGEDRSRQGENKDSKQNDSKQNDARQNEHTDHNQMQAQGGDQHRGGRIPDEQFRSHFGRQHTFAVSRPTIEGGQPRFQYGGYSFAIMGAWPSEWSYSDECYVDYINGEYLLFDMAHPGVSVAVVVVM
jgi:hypothetical protein